MKAKFLLLFLVVTSSLTAQNLLKNGNFDADFVPFTYNGQNWSCPEYIEGWDKSADYLDGKYYDSEFNNDGFSKWNMRAEIHEIDYSEDWMTDDNLYYLHIQRFEDNGWYDSGIYQTVEITNGEKYDLSFYYRTSLGEVAEYCREPKFNVQFFEYGDNPETTHTIEKGALLKDFELSHEVEWTFYEQKDLDFEGIEKIVLHFRLNASHCGEKPQANKSVYIEIDEVVLSKAESGQGISKEQESSIRVMNNASEIEIEGLTPNTRVDVYNVNGMKVATETASSDKLTIPVSGLAKGLYIVKVENQSFKVIR